MCEDCDEKSVYPMRGPAFSIQVLNFLGGSDFPLTLPAMDLKARALADADHGLQWAQT